MAYCKNLMNLNNCNKNRKGAKTVRFVFPQILWTLFQFLTQYARWFYMEIPKDLWLIGCCSHKLESKEKWPMCWRSWPLSLWLAGTVLWTRSWTIMWTRVAECGSHEASLKGVHLTCIRVACSHWSRWRGRLILCSASRSRAYGPSVLSAWEREKREGENEAEGESKAEGGCAGGAEQGGGRRGQHDGVWQRPQLGRGGASSGDGGPGCGGSWLRRVEASVAALGLEPSWRGE